MPKQTLYDFQTAIVESVIESDKFADAVSEQISSDVENEVEEAIDKINIEQKVRDITQDWEDRIEKLEETVEEQREEILTLSQNYSHLLRDHQQLMRQLASIPIIGRWFPYTDDLEM